VLQLKLKTERNDSRKSQITDAGHRPRQEKEIGFYVEILASKSVPNITCTLISETANAKPVMKYSSNDKRVF
jgi:hypothetical protein